MTRNVRPLGAVLVGLLVGLVVAFASRGEAAPPECVDGEVGACPLANGCGGVHECVGESWAECHCGGQPWAPGGTGECESSCDGQRGLVVCDVQCQEVVGCMTDTCSACGEQSEAHLVCPTGGTTPLCVAPEACNGCDDDQDGVVDNAPGNPSAGSLETSCNPNSCSVGGTAKCSDGKWGECTGCSGVGTCTVCAGTATFDCSQGCQGVCTRPEQCNSCDDDGDGVLDNGLHCAPCAL